MMGTKVRACVPLTGVSLNDLVPADHFYRHLDATLDLSFVRDLVRDTYAAGGRPSIDPVVFFKLQLVLFFEGLRSERQLMQVVADRLSLRWYVGYDLTEPLPDHSSLTKIRERYGVETFRRFFEAILERCREAGLLWGKEVYADATKVQANAAYTSTKPRFAVEAHLHRLFGEGAVTAGDPAAEATAAPAPLALPEPELRPGDDAVAAALAAANQEYDDWIERHGRPERGDKPLSDCWTADYCVSTTDPDATVLHLKDGGPRLGYQTHYLVDGGKARLIVNVLATPAEVKENEPLLDLLRQAQFRWHLQPEQVTGDSKYATAEIIGAVERAGMHAYVPLPAPTPRTGFYPKEAFTYDAEHDEYICPQGTRLTRRQVSYTQQVVVYQAPAEVCNACPLKARCTTSDAGRHLHRQFDEEYLDRVRSYRGTAAYEKALRKRGVWVEPLFAEAKQWHGLRRFRLRGLEQVNREALLVAAGQNLKRLLSRRGWGRRGWPSGAPGLSVNIPAFLALA